MLGVIQKADCLLARATLSSQVGEELRCEGLCQMIDLPNLVIRGLNAGVGPPNTFDDMSNSTITGLG